MRRAANTDANQPALVEYLRSAGCSVAITAGVGNGFPDLVVAKARWTILVEVKDPAKDSTHQKLNEKQVRFHANWKGAIFVLKSIDEAAQLLKILDSLTCASDFNRARKPIADELAELEGMMRAPQRPKDFGA